MRPNEVSESLGVNHHDNTTHNQLRLGLFDVTSYM